MKLAFEGKQLKSNTDDIYFAAKREVLLQSG